MIADLHQFLFKSQKPDIYIIGAENSELVVQIIKAVKLARAKGFEPGTIKLSASNEEVAVGVSVKNGSIVCLKGVPDRIRYHMYMNLTQ